MIVPVGKNKHQVNQGGMKHESFLNNPDFAKLAADFSGITDKPEQPTAAPVEEKSPVPGLQDAMNQGGLKEPPPEEETSPEAAVAPQPGIAPQQKSRQDAIVAKMLQELKEANMLPTGFVPNIQMMEFRSSGKQIQIIVPGLPAGPQVQHP